MKTNLERDRGREITGRKELQCVVNSSRSGVGVKPVDAATQRGPQTEGKDERKERGKKTKNHDRLRGKGLAKGYF